MNNCTTFSRALTCDRRRHLISATRDKAVALTRFLTYRKTRPYCQLFHPLRDAFLILRRVLSSPFPAIQLTHVHLGIMKAIEPSFLLLCIIQLLTTH